MSKSTPLIKVYASVRDDEGELHDVWLEYGEKENMFECIEDAAYERGIRYVTTFMFQIEDNSNE